MISSIGFVNGGSYVELCGSARLLLNTGYQHCGSRKDAKDRKARVRHLKCDAYSWAKFVFVLLVSQGHHRIDSNCPVCRR